jgi:hypothetical protein
MVQGNPLKAVVIGERGWRNKRAIEGVNLVNEKIFTCETPWCNPLVQLIYT